MIDLFVNKSIHDVPFYIVYIEVMSFDQLVKIVAERKSGFVS
ncbi:hypothetical protein MGSAQ_000010 [marine sediment metagenome]|uniref:Uncharacterized protein n=1 Tax=marine sediment metagenome TaxID=412755 RepID=A0A1B6NYP0_9ZZZZ